MGITGTNGAGKGTFVELLQNKFNLKHLSARSMIVELAQRDGVGIINRDDLREYNEKRNREGKSLVQEIDKLYNTDQNKNITFIFESVRRVNEIKQLKELFGEDFILLGVDADQGFRYERVVLRNSMSDKVSFEEFVEHERLESVSEDENQMNIPKCISLANFVIDNNGSMGDLEKQVDQLVSKYPNFFPQQ